MLRFRSQHCCACRTELDILRVDTSEGNTRFASCIAAYGEPPKDMRRAAVILAVISSTKGICGSQCFVAWSKHAITEPPPPASIICAGFMGDVMAASEGYRWLGPVRYDLVGAAKLLANSAYRAKVQ